MNTYKFAFIFTDSSAMINLFQQCTLFSYTGHSRFFSDLCLQLDSQYFRDIEAWTHNSLLVEPQIPGFTQSAELDWSLHQVVPVPVLLQFNFFPRLVAIRRSCSLTTLTIISLNQCTFLSRKSFMFWQRRNSLELVSVFLLFEKFGAPKFISTKLYFWCVQL